MEKMTEKKEITKKEAKRLAIKMSLDRNKGKEPELERQFLLRNYLEDPELLDYINEELDKKIVGEKESRTVIFLKANMRNVENLNKGSDNLIVNAYSGTGKDHVTESIFELIPESEKEELGKATPKVLSYTRNKEVDEGATWVKTCLRLEDLQKSTLNDESFKVFLSANPNKTNKGQTLVRGKVLTILIEGKPSIILTVAEAELGNEQLRRLPMIFLDEGVNQTKAIVDRQADFAEKGIPIEYDADLIKALGLLKRVKVKIPFAKKLIPIFEKSLGNVIIRTTFPRFLDDIKSSAALFQFQRVIDKEGYVVANEKDLVNGLLCLKKTTSNVMMIPLSKLDQSIYDLFKAKQFIKISLDDLNNSQEIQKLGKGERWIRERLDFLVSKDFLSRESEKVEGINKPINKYSYTHLAEFNIPEIRELLEKTSISSNTSNKTNTTNKSNKTNTSNIQEKRVNEVFEVNATELQKHTSPKICITCGSSPATFNNGSQWICENCASEASK